MKSISLVSLFLLVSAFGLTSCNGPSERQAHPGAAQPGKPTPSSPARIKTKKFVWHGGTIEAGMTKKEVISQIKKGGVPKGWAPGWALRPGSKDTYSKDEWYLILGSASGAWPGATSVIVTFIKGKVAWIASYPAPVA